MRAGPPPGQNRPRRRKESCFETKTSRARARATTINETSCRQSEPRPSLALGRATRAWASDSRLGERLALGRATRAWASDSRLGERLAPWRATRALASDSRFGERLALWRARERFGRKAPLTVADGFAVFENNGGVVRGALGIPFMSRFAWV